MFCITHVFFVAIDRQKADTKVAQLRKKVRTLSKKCERQHQKLCQLNDLVADLKQKKLIENEPADALTNYFDATVLELVKNEFLNHKRTKSGCRYSDSVKQFALTLFYYSPQAYDYCRTILSLPHPSSLRNWLSNIDADPGFLTNVIEMAASSGEKDYCLILDSMACRKQTIYEHGKLLGFCDYGGVVVGDRDALASEALVFILVPLKGSARQYIIGYFLVDKINAQVQAELVNTALILTADQGLHVNTVTCDGCAANISTLNILGASMDPLNCIPFFSHPVTKNKVFATLDICHMLKLARNALAEMGCFVTKDGSKICWECITKLSHYQDQLGLHLGNKLSIAHINWQKAKMKVKLAAQVFSRSVADALLFLHQQHIPGFEGCMATVEFIRQVSLIMSYTYRAYTYILLSYTYRHV